MTYVFKDGSIGYIWPRTEKSIALPESKPPPPVINARRIIEEWTNDTPDEWLEEQAYKLGVTVQSLRDLEACYSPKDRATAFPMRDGYGNIVGIRLRSDGGFKWAVTGSHQGIFLPRCDSLRTAYVCEGPTDTAAALSIGLWSVGRASCSAGLSDIPKVFKRLKIQRAVIVSDNDSHDAGLKGAAMLGRQLGIPYCILMLPCKDLRAFVRSGGTALMLENLLNDTVWIVP